MTFGILGGKHFGGLRLGGGHSGGFRSGGHNFGGNRMGGGHHSGGFRLGGGHNFGGNRMGGGHHSGGFRLGGGHNFGGNRMGGGHHSGGLRLGGGQHFGGHNIGGGHSGGGLGLSNLFSRLTSGQLFGGGHHSGGGHNFTRPTHQYHPQIPSHISNQVVQGLSHLNGAQGPRGVSGADGRDGAPGPAGRDGVSFDQVFAREGFDTNGNGRADRAELIAAFRGTTGAKGDTGAQGPTGAKGDTGEKGDMGATGTKGDTGADGKDGTQGADGAENTTRSLFALISKLIASLSQQNGAGTGVQAGNGADAGNGIDAGSGAGNNTGSEAGGTGNAGSSNPSLSKIVELLASLIQKLSKEGAGADAGSENKAGSGVGDKDAGSGIGTGDKAGTGVNGKDASTNIGSGNNDTGKTASTDSNLTKVIQLLESLIQKLGKEGSNTDAGSGSGTSTGGVGSGDKAGSATKGSGTDGVSSGAGDKDAGKTTSTNSQLSQINKALQSLIQKLGKEDSGTTVDGGSKPSSTGAGTGADSKEAGNAGDVNANLTQIIQLLQSLTEMINKESNHADANTGSKHPSTEAGSGSKGAGKTDAGAGSKETGKASADGKDAGKTASSDSNLAQIIQLLQSLIQILGKDGASADIGAGSQHQYGASNNQGSNSNDHISSGTCKA